MFRLFITIIVDEDILLIRTKHNTTTLYLSQITLSQLIAKRKLITLYYLVFQIAKVNKIQF